MKFLISAFLTMFVVVSAACQKPTLWKEYRPDDGSFSVEFPGSTVAISRTSPLNKDVTYPVVQWKGDGVLLQVVYAEVPGLRLLNEKESREYYEFLRTQSVKMNPKTQLMQEEDVTVNGKLGNDYIVVGASGKATHYRLFLIGTKLLTLQAEQDVGVRPQADTDDTVDKFMTSLKFP